MTYDTVVKDKIEKISVNLISELNMYLDYLIFKSQEKTKTPSRAELAYKNLLSYVGKISVDENYKESLAKSRSERYESND